MKPLQLKMQAFGPYVQMQTVDFEKLAEKGMFLIKGPTGSGKTTIFDAMTFALYGGSSGDDSKSKVGRNDLEEWRCNQAASSEATVVTFRFSVRGKRYEFTRRLVPKRVKLSEEYSAGEIDDHGILHPFFNNPKKDMLTKKAEELIGLTKEQFRQVVLLPQGQFERFLTAGSEEKGLILGKIFDAQRWEAYAQNFYGAALDRKNALAGEKSEISASLAEEGLKTLPELDARISQQEAARQQNEADRLAFDAEGKQKALAEDIALGERFQALHELEGKWKALADQAEDIQADRSLLSRSTAAESLRPVISDFEKAQGERDKRRGDWKRKQEQLPDLQKKTQAAEKALKDWQEASPVARLQKRSGELASKRETYQTLQGLETEKNEAEKTWKEKKSQGEAAAQALEEANREARESYLAYNDAESQEKDLRNRYYSGIYGEIAGQLEKDCPCPVCGSLTHPAPAARAENSVSKKTVDTAEKATRKAKENWEKQEQDRKTAEGAKDQAAKELAESQRAWDRAQESLKYAQASLIPGIPTLADLEREIQNQETAIAQWQNREQALQASLEREKKQLDTLAAQAAAAEEELRQATENRDLAGERLEKALAEKGYGHMAQAKEDLRTEEERTGLSEKIHKYDGAVEDTGKKLEEQQAALSQRLEPDKSQFETRQREISEKTQAFARRASTLEGDIQRLTQKKRALEKKQAHYDANILEAENDLKVAEKVRGSSGIGLQRYVLAILFNQVIGEANRMLAKVHEGRYHLFRSDDKGKGNKRGLELKVHDNRCPEAQGRSVSMLSGGEKFLVSLALSIGLSTVAQRGGVQIEALFIDEGFGTLDDSSIHDAMDVLESVRRSSGMIGIISHVQLLESNIPTHLEVIKSGEGSRIRLA